MMATTKRLYAEIISFLMVGASAAAAHYFGALGLIEALGIHVQLANFIGFCLGFAVSYLGQSILTFSSRPNWSNLVRYLLLAGFNLAASAALLKLMTGVLNWEPRLALLVVVVTLPAFSFVVSKTVIFVSCAERD